MASDSSKAYRAAALHIVYDVDSAVFIISLCAIFVSIVIVESIAGTFWCRFPSETCRSCLLYHMLTGHIVNCAITFSA